MWFLIVTLIPNAIVLGGLAGHAMSLCLYPFLFIRTKLKIPQNLKLLLLVTVAFSITIVFSIAVSMNRAEIGLSVVKYAFVPFYWLFGLYVGMTEAKLFKNRGTKLLFYVATIFIIVQLPVVFLQLIGHGGLISVFWSVTKVSSLGHIVRVVGTVGNPNRLGILCILAIIIFVQNVKQKRTWSVILIVISVLLIAATGSRTSLVLLLLLPFFHISRNQLFSKKTFYILLLGIAFLVSSYYLLLHYQKVLPYLSQILNLFSAGKVHSLQGRFINWNLAFETYRASSVIHHWFGLGAGYFTVMDNSYYYILFNYGIVGLIIFIGVLGTVFRTTNSQDNKIALRLLFAGLVAGLVADLLVSFLFITLIFYLIGFKAELQHSRIPGPKRNLAYAS